MTEKGERKDKGKLIFLSFPYSSVLQIAGHKPLVGYEINVVGYEINVVSHDLAFKKYKWNKTEKCQSVSR